ncbi:hypothetical protein [Streptomyces sp. NPDC058441]|uniref:hypothetical protein n=1 Tax=Streptomyces sp. NPDC058441 TaxID=3346502 RepID=UPI003655AFA3
MLVDVKAMAEIARDLFAVKVHRELGAAGAQTLRELITRVRETHDALTTERIVKGLTVVRTLGTGAVEADMAPAVFTQTRELTAWYRQEAGPLSVHFGNDGTIRAWCTEIDTSAITGQYVCYRYTGPQKEQILTPTGVHGVPTIANFPSYFAVPYFLDLRESLVRYGNISVRSAQCDIFRATWREPARLVFVNKPEATMRRSLQQYLRASLRDHGPIQVMPEQNVNETKPVDIKVTWTASNRVALIEIKWLGLSHDATKQTKTPYAAGRARQGAKQLAAYLDSYHTHDPDTEARGYLVVFDGRRKSVAPESTSVNHADGFHYAMAEIDYPQDLLARHDFEAPVRFFCEPECE